MRIALASVYEEVGTSFHLSHLVVKFLREKLQELFNSLEISEFSEKFGGNDFSLGFIISATRSSESLIVNGPVIMKKPKAVDFVLLIPFRQISDSQEKIDYVLTHITDGVEQVLRRYNAPDPGVAETVKNVATTIREDPQKFEYIPKSARRPR
jgi:hypothetical protein